MNRSLSWFAALALLLGLAASSARAQFVWIGNGTTASFSDTGNWQGGVAPGGSSGTEDLTFGVLTGSQSQPSVQAPGTYNSITFSGGAGRPLYLINGFGTQTLTLNGGITMNTGATAELGDHLILSLPAGVHQITVNEPSNPLLIYSNITGAGSITANGPGYIELIGNNTFAGGVIVQSGSLNFDTGTTTYASANTVVGQTNGSVGDLLITNGAVLTDNMGIIGDVSAGAIGDVRVYQAGAKWINNTYVYVGTVGQGTLEVLAGGSVTTPNISIGNNAGGVGTVMIDGSGSLLDVSNTIYVGSAGQGTLTVTANALVQSATVSIGNNAGGSGSALIDGGGTVWNNSGVFLVGNASHGTLQIHNDAAVNTASATIGVTAGVIGVVSLDAPSVLSATNSIIVGASGNGTIDASTGGVLSSGTFGRIGDQSGSTGLVMLGGDAAWTIGSGGLEIGFTGVGTLELMGISQIVVNGGSGTVTLGTNLGGVGTLNIGWDGTMVNSGGIVNANLVTTGSGVGQVTFGTDATSSSPYYFTHDGTMSSSWVVIGGPTHVTVNGGYNVLGGTNTYAGGTSVTNDGTLVAYSNNALGSGTVTVAGSGPATLLVPTGVTLPNAISLGSGGVVSGSGTYTSPLTVASGGAVAPGTGIGPTAFSNGLTLGAGGAFNLEIKFATLSAGSGYDTVNVSGAAMNITATSGTPFILRLISLNSSGNPGNVSDFNSTNPYSFTVATATAGITNFAANKFTIDASGFTNSLGGGAFSVSQSGNTLLVNFTPVPEPSTVVLTLLGLGVVAASYRRRRKAGL